jgi:hypothetical protein
MSKLDAITLNGYVMIMMHAPLTRVTLKLDVPTWQLFVMTMMHVIPIGVTMKQVVVQHLLIVMITIPALMTSVIHHLVATMLK